MGWSSWNDHFVSLWYEHEPEASSIADLGDLRSPDRSASWWHAPSCFPAKNTTHVQEILSDMSSICIEWLFVGHESKKVYWLHLAIEREGHHLVFLISPQKTMSGLMQTRTGRTGRGFLEVTHMRPLSLTCALQAIDVLSIGCIYAELLGMLEGNKMEDRAPDQSSCRLQTALSCWSMQIIRERADAA